MTFYSEPELIGFLNSQESQLVERKRSAGDRSGIRRNICAFANDLPGNGHPGVIFVGVDDDGRCSGIEVGDELLRTLANMRSDGNIVPLPSMTVDRTTIEGCTLSVIQVEPAREPPVRYQGRAWVKAGPTAQQASPEEEQRLSERRRSWDQSFDLRPSPDAAIDDLDLDYARTQYVPRAIAQEVLERNRRPLEQQLRSLRLVAGESPTWGALLGLGRDPQRWRPGGYVQFLRIDGQRLTDPIRDQKVLTGRLEDVLRQLDELLKLNVSIRTDIATSAREVQFPDYPVAALRQLARNAVMHRAYEGTNAPVHVYWYEDRVEIRNPGGLYGQVTPENFGMGVTDCRNSLVAEIMLHLGFAQRFGLGIPLAREELEKNGNPDPDFQFLPAHFAVTVRAAT